MLLLLFICFIQSIGAIYVHYKLSHCLTLTSRAIKNCFRRLNDDMKNRTRWEDDLDLEEHPQFIMFDEYLEMGAIH